MYSKEIIIWGATGQSIVLEELLSHYNIKINSVFDNNRLLSSPFEKVKLLYGINEFKKWRIHNKNVKYFIVAIGGYNGKVRCELSDILYDFGLKPYSAIHPTAFIANNAIIGEGAQVLANSSICARVVIGKYCIVNTSASIDHECEIGDGVHIAPGVKIAGNVKIGDYTFVGINSTILPRVVIGKNVIIGAGSVVTKNIESNSIVIGVPAKFYKMNVNE